MFLIYLTKVKMLSSSINVEESLGGLQLHENRTSFVFH